MTTLHGGLHGGLRGPDDPFRDFCLWDYPPAAAATPDTLCSYSLLLQSLTLHPDGRKLRSAFEGIRARWGDFNTVWGIKSAPSGQSYELYFYDYDRAARRRGIADLMACLPGLCPPSLAQADALPWFMMSVEFDATTLNGRGIPAVDLYFEAQGGTISAGRSDTWDGQSRRPKNDYHFFRSAIDRAEILADLQGLAPLPAPFAPGRYGEEVFVTARKSHANAIYFSRVTNAQTMHFMQDAGFAPALAACFAQDSARLAPYRFDLGIDYAPTGAVLRSAVYGVF